MSDFVIGPVINIIDGSTFQINVTHIGVNNRFTYRDYETVTIPNDSSWRVSNRDNMLTLNHAMIGRTMKCYVRYRDSYNRLYADCELIP
jgi:hypothetical protein